MKLFAYQIYQALLNLRRKPGLVVSVCLSMGLTLGVLITALTLYYTSFISPLPYPEQQNLYTIDPAINLDIKSNGHNRSVELRRLGALIELYQRPSKYLKDKALVQYGTDVISDSSNATVVEVAHVTPSWLSIFSAKFVVGRGFSKDEDMNSLAPVAVISNKLWHEEFNADLNITDKSITLSGTTYRIIGVLNKDYTPPQLSSTGRQNDIWLPWDYNFLQHNFVDRVTQPWNTGYNQSNTTLVAKYRDINEHSAHKLDITNLLTQAAYEHIKIGSNSLTTPSYELTLNVSINHLSKQIQKNSQVTVLMFLTGAIALLVIALANTLYLVYSRIVELNYHHSVHVALGAKPLHIFSAILSEIMLLLTAASTLGLIVTYTGLVSVKRYIDEYIPRANELVLNENSFLFALILLCLLSIILSWLGAKKIDFQALNQSLAGSGKGLSKQISKKQRNFLSNIQLTVAITVMLTSFTLAYQSYMNQTIPTDINTNNMYFLSLSFDGRKRPPKEEIFAFNQQLVKQLIQRPEVNEATNSASFTSPGTSLDFAVNTVDENGRQYQLTMLTIGAKHNQILNNPMLKGREFDRSDYFDTDEETADPSTSPVIVNQQFAESGWFGKLGPQIGQTYTVPINDGDSLVTVIGISKGVKFIGEKNIPNRIFWPQIKQRTHFLLQLNPNAKLTREQLVSAIHSLDKRWTVRHYFSFNDYRDVHFAADRMLSIIAMAISILTAFLASLGIHGMYKVNIQTRAREIATRAALGASSTELYLMMFHENVKAQGMAYTLACFVFFPCISVYALNSFVSYPSTAHYTAVLVTGLIVSAISWLSTYMPMREIVNRSPMRTLNLNE